MIDLRGKTSEGNLEKEIITTGAKLDKSSPASSLPAQSLQQLSSAGAKREHFVQCAQLWMHHYPTPVSGVSSALWIKYSACKRPSTTTFTPFLCVYLTIW